MWRDHEFGFLDFREYGVDRPGFYYNLGGRRPQLRERIENWVEEDSNPNFYNPIFLPFKRPAGEVNFLYLLMHGHYKKHFRCGYLGTPQWMVKNTFNAGVQGGWSIDRYWNLGSKAIRGNNYLIGPGTIIGSGVGIGYNNDVQGAIPLIHTTVESGSTEYLKETINLRGKTPDLDIFTVYVNRILLSANSGYPFARSLYRKSIKPLQDEGKLKVVIYANITDVMEIPELPELRHHKEVLAKLLHKYSGYESVEAVEIDLNENYEPIERVNYPEVHTESETV
jgi:hypothetical protein